jgi:nucleoside-diphosphate-sugar epimerase
MISPAAKGERFLAVARDVVTLIDVAMILKKRLGPIARRVPTREMPDWLVRLLANFIPDLRLIALELGNVRNLTNAKAKRILNWTPRSNEDCIVATAESLQRLSLLKA